ncbi:DUF3667 domain-containing protein [Cytophagaceae bacterium YF14B1]|uniref:DUF3667 domain-containing protein n=1 Tax=Xanthocytophaga flava TaxID=3048013 RepID=A0AAE3U6C7_9BACT|nr:DUF3667 domain-containing protein [Xanthocytophaga flavus]MDJ1478938.1 DUF3667 domain-containing protein [Xanthocytophaga flavus]
MHETHRKQFICPNCQHILSEADNFCAQCGQENTTKVISFGTLIYEVVSDFVSWDSRWFQTVVPFLFKPGHLTNEFINGKRMRYMPPLRLYFFISVICFSIIAYYTAKENKHDERKEQALKQEQADSIRNAVIRELPTDIPATQREQIKNALQNLTLNEKLGGFIDEAIKKGEKDSSSNNEDSLNLNLGEEVLPAKEGKKKVKTNFKWKTDTNKDSENSDQEGNDDSRNNNDDTDDEDNDNSGKFGELGLLTKLVKNPALSEKDILDSLRWEDNYWNRMKINRLSRWTDGSKEEFIAEMWDKAPIFMFVMLPFMAMVMKFLYIRRKRLYIEHLIFMLHLHAFMFFLIAIDIVLSNEFENLNPSGIIVPLILLYIWVAFYKVYKQGWFRTSFKIFTFLFLYSIVFSTLAIIGLVVAAAIY